MSLPTLKINKAALAAAITACINGAAFAQDNSTKDVSLEVIEVTASKRTTSETETPISMNFVSGANIQERGITNLEDISVSIPNMNIGTGQPTDVISVRGMSSGTDRGFEQSVSMFIDNIYMSRSRQYRAGFFDMANVQILRGPQSLLYGLNATAGTIIVATASNEPGDDLEVVLGAEFEPRYSQYRTSAIIGGGISDTLGGRLAVRVTGGDEGFYYNTTTQENEGVEDEVFLRGSLVWAPTDNLDVTTKLTYIDYKRTGGTGECFSHGALGNLTVVLGQCDGELDFRRQSGALGALKLIEGVNDQFFNQEMLLFSTIANYEMENHDLTVSAGYAKTDFDTAFDVAALGIPLFANAHHESHEQFNLEARIASDADADFSYIVGMYLGDQTMDQLIPTVTSPPVLASSLEYPGSKSTTQTISPFVSTTTKLTENLRLIAGIRLSREEKEATRTIDACYVPTENGVGAPIPIENCQSTFPGEQPSFKATNWMPEATLMYNYSDNGNVYFKVGKSVKSGGHTLNSSVGTEEGLIYGDETAETAELGLKAFLLEGTLSLNTAAFYTEYSDLQVNSFVIEGDQVLSSITNAGASEAKGLEFEARYAATEWLTLTWNHALLSHKYTSFDNGPCGVGQVPDVIVLGDTPTACSKSGSDTPFSPSYSGSLDADVNFSISANLYFVGGVTVSYSDQYFADGTLDPFVAQSAFERIDARLGIEDYDQTWKLAIVGKNLTDEVILGASQSVGIEGLGHLLAPRTITLQGTYKF